MQISSGSFRHFKGISRYKLVFLNTKICIIVKPLDHEILLVPNINSRWKTFEQELASTIRQNMNSWTGNISAESRGEGDSTSCCCPEKRDRWNGRKVPAQGRWGVWRELLCQAVFTSAQSRNNRTLGERRKGMTGFAVAAQKASWCKSTASCPRGRQCHKATSLSAKPSSAADTPEPTSPVRAAAELPAGLRLERSYEMNQTEKTPRPVRTRWLWGLSKYWV